MGLRHTNTPSNLQGDPNSVMNGGTTLSSYSYPANYAFPSNYDAITVNTLYPVNANSIIEPIISGPSSFSSEVNFRLSYMSKEVGINYHWEILGTNGTPYNFNYTDAENNNPGLEVNIYQGTYLMKCTISGGKYTTPVTATKNITVL